MRLASGAERKGMAMDADPTARTISGSTRGLAPHEGYEYFCDAVADVYVGVTPRRPETGGFEAHFALHDLGGISLGIIDTPGVSADRGARSLRQVPDDAFFVNYSSGAWGLGQSGSQWTAAGGTSLVLDNARPFTVVADPRRRLHLVSLRISRDLLDRRTVTDIAAVNDALSRTASGAILGRQMSLLASSARSGMTRVVASMTEAVIDIIDSIPHGSQPSVRVDRMMRFAEARLGDPALDVSAVARAFGCSVRTVQSDFTRAGSTFSEWLRAARLDRAREALLDPLGGGASVAAIARRNGFADVGTFHRAYRNRFGRTPRSDRGGGPSSGNAHGAPPEGDAP